MTRDRYLLALGVLLLAAAPTAADDLLDRVEQALSFSSPDNRLRARVSGLADWEEYRFDGPAPALLKADGDRLGAPRLSLYLDAQAGARVYAFAQARVDRGFDPGDGPLRGRLDEYALRFMNGSGAFQVQVGKFATVVGNWVQRHDSWRNPFITAPLPYENVTGIFDATAAPALPVLLRWANIGPGPYPPAEYAAQLRVPILWGPSYATGASIAGVIGRFHYAAEVKNASLSSRPSQWTYDANDGSHPTFSARVGYQPDEAWQFGWSVSSGSYLTAAADPSLAPGRGRADYREIVLAHDLGYAWHHFQLWAEIFATRFTIPRVGNADTLAYYVEARYRFTPRFSGAVRWNQQFFGSIADPAGGAVRWGRDTWRLEVAPAFRLTPHLQVKVQYGYQYHPLEPRRGTSVAAAQVVLKF